MKGFMLVVPDLGKDKWNIVGNLSECFLGTRPIGETWKFSNGGGGRDLRCALLPLPQLNLK